MKKLITVKGAAEKLGVSREAVYSSIDDGRLTVFMTEDIVPMKLVVIDTKFENWQRLPGGRKIGWRKKKEDS